MLQRIFSLPGLFALSALFIVYGTTIPWDISPPPAWDTVQWRPFWDAKRGRIASIPDIVQNVLLFMPFGALGWLWLRRGWLVVLSGTSLSASVELLQTMSPTRVSSTTDLCTNTVGALVGVLIAWAAHAPLESRVLPALRRRAREAPGSLILFALLLAAAWLAFAPFLPTLDVDAIKGQVKTLLAAPWGPKSHPQLLFIVVFYAGIAVVWSREVALSRLWLFVFALALEAAQLVLRGHSVSAQDVAAAWLGISLGWSLSYWTGTRPQASEGGAHPPALSRSHGLLALAFALLIPILRALDPFRFGPWSTPPLWNLVPFAAIFRSVNVWTIANFFAVIASYLPLAHVLRLQGRSVPQVALISFAVAAVLEVLQIPVENRTFDMTEAWISMAAALVVLRLHAAVSLLDDNPARPYVLLVAEPHAGFRQSLRETFEAAGVRVIEAAHGKDAMKHLRRSAIDGILSEVLLPRVDGLTLLQTDRELGFDRCFVLMATEPRPGPRETAIALGVDDYLRLPMELEELRDRVVAALEAPREFDAS